MMPIRTMMKLLLLVALGVATHLGTTLAYRHLAGPKVPSCTCGGTK